MGQDLGSVWSAPRDSLQQTYAGSAAGHAPLTQALSLGYFSQYTSIAEAGAAQAIVDWQIAWLKQHHGLDVGDLPQGLVEVPVVPAATQVERHGRLLSPDLLRNTGCALLVLPLLAGIDAPTVLEIGSGYGAFARVFKRFRPGARIVLVDIAESLACARDYLTLSEPQLTVRDFDEPEAASADFMLVPIEHAGALAGRSFDLAVNIWSFGEMTNAYLDRWFALLENECRVERLYTVNSVMVPVTAQEDANLVQGDWIMRLGQRWDIEHFSLRPAMSDCPCIKNFPAGAEIVARRLDGADALATAASRAQAQSRPVVLEDWVRLACGEVEAAVVGRPENTVDPTRDITADQVKLAGLLGITRYVGYFPVDPGMQGTFFRLWNDFRLSATPLSGALLVVLIAMLGKSDPVRRISKDEYNVLRRLPPLPLHEEYWPYFDKVVAPSTGAASREQEACDLGVALERAKNLPAAAYILLSVVSRNPRHGFAIAWLGRIHAAWGDTALARVLHRLAVISGNDDPALAHAVAGSRSSPSFRGAMGVPSRFPANVHDACRRFAEAPHDLSCLRVIARHFHASGDAMWSEAFWGMHDMARAYAAAKGHRPA